MLSACYEQVKKQGHGFEVVFISADRDEGLLVAFVWARFLMPENSVVQILLWPNAVDRISLW
jgi:hypothetical protein